MKMHPFLRFLVIFALIFVGLLLIQEAHSATPGGHYFDTKFTSAYIASWNHKHPKAPITSMACYFFAQFNPKEAGIPGPGSAATPVPAHESCMVAERYRTKVICGEINVKPRFSANDPDTALLAGEALPCKQVYAAIQNARNAYRRTA